MERPFANDDPTIRPPINPGPYVDAIASIVEKLILLIFVLNKLRISKCWRAAISGMTPPCFDETSMINCFKKINVFDYLTAIDVSSQELSIAKTFINIKKYRFLIHG